MEAKIIKVTDKGQISLPVKVRESMDIEEGDELLVMASENSIILKPKDKETPLSDVYKLKEKAKDVHVKGIKGITHVLPIKDKDGNYIIHCAGSNLKDSLLKMI